MTKTEIYCDTCHKKGVMQWGAPPRAWIQLQLVTDKERMLQHNNMNQEQSRDFCSAACTRSYFDRCMNLIETRTGAQ